MKSVSSEVRSSLVRVGMQGSLVLLVCFEVCCFLSCGWLVGVSCSNGLVIGDWCIGSIGA